MTTITMAMSRNRPNRMRASEPAPEAMPVKPRPPAISEITKQMRAHFRRVMASLRLRPGAGPDAAASTGAKRDRSADSGPVRFYSYPRSVARVAARSAGLRHGLRRHVGALEHDLRQG